MSTQETGAYQVTGWDEKPYDEIEGGAKLTKASITNTFTGVIEGAGAAEYLMAYPSETYAEFAGVQRIDGAVGGRSGSFLLRTTGVFEGGVAKGEWSVIPGSGTGDLKGLSGTGGYTSGEGGAADVTFAYDLA
ncbi:DUF3224 domain-containing protein [Paractinoplanes atraurantiacus]|uniref:DUF3224 domain-containing protein n=1 Tax=Paractinoplanes atraurantiacus TaxID=1036182 RepID=A0A285GMF1_9ACTN|nr:DUF3224 domain-containing protein [Actinoplanes atraurantiacus]SNY24483.1 Protein of unknown function [Actinoplanes atraurantiacus]